MVHTAPTASPQTLPVGQYYVMEHFYTLQGEGAFTGTAAYFIRLGGCDVGCHWCDVKESWDAYKHPVLTADALAGFAEASGTERVVITGGEPLLHNLDALTAALHAAGMKTHIETSGTQTLSGNLDWVTFSPKKFKLPLDDFYTTAHELKVIVYNPHDLVWAEGHAAQVNNGCLCYLQPEWSTPESVGWILDYVKQNPRWRLSLQTHKFINIP